MKDLTVIIPLHEYDDTIGNSLMNAIESVKNKKMMITIHLSSL